MTSSASPTSGDLRHTDAPDIGLASSDARYRRLFEAAQDGILLLNAQTAQIEDVNPYLIKMLGYSHSEFLGKKLWELGAFADIAQCEDMFAELQRTGYVRFENWPLRTALGGRINVEFISNCYECDGVTVIQCSIRNITDRVIAEARAQRLSHLYEALSECNRAIVQSERQADLFPRVCRAAVRFGGIKFAWIGLVEPGGSRVVPVASFGDDGTYARDLDISTDPDSPFGKGATGIAIREMRPVWVMSRDDPAFAPWRERAESSGLVATTALPLTVDGAAVGAFSLMADDADIFDPLIRSLLIEIAADISYALEHFAQRAVKEQADSDLKAAYLGTIEVATMLTEMRDPYTAGHERRVADIAVAIGTEMGFDAGRLELLHVAGLLHDVGKITVPLEILSKPGRLTALEIQLVHTHAEASYLVLKNAHFPWPVALVARQHQERMDGSGYPLGLKGEEILLESRIMAVADVVEAMSSHRPYRTALGIEAALDEVLKGRGRLYDPAVADACLRVFNDRHYVIPA